MTPYKGIVQISCTRKKGCLRNLKVNNVQPGCMDCPEAITRILDLDGKVVFEYKTMPQRHQPARHPAGGDTKKKKKE